MLMPETRFEAEAAPNAGAIDAIVRAHGPMVRRALRQLGVPAEQVEDATQDVFVVLVRRIDDFDRSRSLTNWLWGIAKGVASGYRRSGRRRGRLQHALTVETVSPPRESSARAVAAGQAGAILERFLGELDQGKCAVFVMAEIEGATGPEIARRLDLNLNTVYARLRSARQCFRAAVASHHEPNATPLFAGLLPSLPKPSLAIGSAALAAALVLPIAAQDMSSIDAPRFAGYRSIPDASLGLAASIAGMPDEAPAATSRPRRAVPTRKVETASVDEEIVIIEDDDDDTALEDIVFFDTDGAGLGQGMGRNPAAKHAAGDEGDDPMFAVTLAAMIAAPSPDIPEPTEAEADAAALLDGATPQAREYIFGEDDVEGEVLGPEGESLHHPSRIRFGSLITIRAHFMPELIRIATDL